MKPVYSHKGVDLYLGSALDVLRALPSESVQLCVTSPPYWGLRAYGTEPQVWGGAEGCEHAWSDENKSGQRIRNGLGGTLDGGTAKLEQNVTLHPSAGATCRLCGAWRGELGSEVRVDCGRHKELDEMTLRDDLSDEERAYVIGELLKLGVIR